MYFTFNPYVTYAKEQFFTHKRKKVTNIRKDYLFFYMTRGFFTYEVNGVRGKLSKGEGLLIPPGSVYTIGLDYQELTIFRVIDFDLEGEDYHRVGLGPFPVAEAPKNMKCTPTQKPFDTVKHYVGIEDLEYMVNDMISRYAKRGEHYLALISTIMKLFLIECEVRNEKIKIKGDMLSMVENYLEEHYHEQITNSNIASALSYHPYYISATMKKMTGQTLREYILSFRLQKAKYYLRESQKSITKISSACGFTSHSYFSMTFARAFGMSPSKYRKKHQYQVY